MERYLNDRTILKNEDTVPYISFKSFNDIPWLKCGFSTRLGGVSKGIFSTMNMSFMRGDDKSDVLENIGRFSASAGFLTEQIVMPHQCHTTNIRVVGKEDCGCGVTKPGCKEEIDGQITSEKNVVLYCMGADCVPVFIVDTVKKVISAVHAGWKGTVDDIAGAAVKRMADEFNCDPKDMKAVIGPSICMDCFEVGEEVAERFANRYSLMNKDPDDTVSGIIRPASGEAGNNPTGKYYINLWEANRKNLIGAGLKPDSIEISGYCTKCHPDMLFSHRYHGENRGVNIGFILIDA